ncbi:hypothetical protein BRARA_I02743 [Brassica rapa]|uniref:Uncharacterized protein n=1 Tax=Brassica campestris TaxID=3711 RepID=A0A397Y629_BRACM|nr:hypothetical protein BRARA_I02743 [Brassica rapa]
MAISTPISSSSSVLLVWRLRIVPFVVILSGTHSFLDIISFCICFIEGKREVEERSMISVLKKAIMDDVNGIKTWNN